MAFIRLAYRSVFATGLLLIGLILTPVVQGGTMHRTGLSARTTCAWHKWLARVLGIEVVRTGTPEPHATLYVANHISWFDISALGGLLPLRFLSKDEVRRWPLIGWLATRSGTLYIRRGGRQASINANEKMSRALRDDQNVCLFAEGTTTDGNIRKFHGRLLQSAIDAGCKVQPVAIYYPPPDKAGDDMAHPDILYIGDTTLADSLYRILGSRHIRVEIHFLEAMDTAGKSRDEIARYCEQAVRARIDERHLTLATRPRS